MLLVFLQAKQCVSVVDNVIQFMKTRSSAGVGQKVDLAFDIRGLRITDLPDDAEDTETVATKDIFNKIKNKQNAEAQKESIAQNSVVEDNPAMSRLNSIVKRQNN